MDPFRAGKGRLFFKLQMTGAVDDDKNEKDRHEHAGKDTTHKKLANGFTRNGPIKDHGNGRRNEDTQRSAAGHGAQYNGPVIAPFQHFRNGNGSDCDRAGHTGTCNRGKDAAGDNRRNAKAAGQMPQPLIAQVKKVFPDLSLEQNGAHEDVKRHGAEDKIIESLIGQDGNLLQGAVTGHKKHHAQKTRRTQGKGHRNANGKKHQ